MQIITALTLFGALATSVHAFRPETYVQELESYVEELESLVVNLESHVQGLESYVEDLESYVLEPEHHISQDYFALPKSLGTIKSYTDLECNGGEATKKIDATRVTGFFHKSTVAVKLEASEGKQCVCKS